MIGVLLHIEGVPGEAPRTYCCSTACHAHATAYPLRTDISNLMTLYQHQHQPTAHIPALHNHISLLRPTLLSLPFVQHSRRSELINCFSHDAAFIERQASSTIFGAPTTAIGSRAFWRHLLTILRLLRCHNINCLHGPPHRRVRAYGDGYLHTGHGDVWGHCIERDLACFTCSQNPLHHHHPS